MENKPIIKFLKVMSIFYIIIAVGSAIISALALISLIALPGLQDLAAEAGVPMEITPLTYISIAISLVCGIVNIVLGTMALKHKNLNMVYKIGMFTMLCNEVFTAVELSAPADYLNLALGLIIPVLFLVATVKQIQLDKEGK